MDCHLSQRAWGQDSIESTSTWVWIASLVQAKERQHGPKRIKTERNHHHKTQAEGSCYPLKTPAN